MLASSSSRSIRGAVLIVSLLVGFYYFTRWSSHISPVVDWRSAASSAVVTPEDAPPGSDDAALLASQEGGPRVRQATMIYDSDKFNAVYERSLDAHLKHGKQWGYPTHVLRHDIVDAGFFNKPAFLLGIVIEEMAKPYGQRTHWIVWFDADTVLLNPNVPWTLFLPPTDFEGVNFIGTKDQNGFNAGMFMIRVCEWSVKVLSEVASLREFKPDLQLEYADQSAFKDILERPGYEEHFLFQPHEWWNAFGLQGLPYPTEAFTLHFAGVDCCGEGEKKSVIMGRWLDEIETTPEKYLKPLEQTAFPAAVAEYWARLKNVNNLLETVDKWQDENHYTEEDIEIAKTELKNASMYMADDAGVINSGISKIESIVYKGNSKSQSSGNPDG